MSSLPTELVFAPPPSITMVEDVVLVELDGLTSDWDTYSFSLNIPSPGTKYCYQHIVLRIEHSEFHKYDRPRVREPYAQSIQPENVMLEYVESIKSEESTEVSIAVSEDVIEADVRSEPGDNHVDLLIKLEDRADAHVELDSKDNSTNALPSHKISPFPCRVLTRSTGNPAAEEGMPSQPWKYYVRSFDPRILPDEIARRNEAIREHEEKLERESKRRRVF
ncbi:hypothetical protein PISMIDRAFT_19408 [Pisolithus microcarpus 441]|uniref:Uncharacterized protein n=1 Tax=Pisolithus microcarpus 441 TaxID=765257 RepID=A0A0C9YCH0_9AGAM|nr:hypothetical protein PISMIDRAFT_19408 [Pisolithus microcarpus 441]